MTGHPDPDPAPDPDVADADLDRWVLHVDLDQFIAAVEVLRRPELRGKPVVVGGDGDPTKRSVVATASYEAREFGVRSGMPMRTALARCPDAVFLPSDAAAYDAASVVVMDTLRSFDVVVEVMGWDEAFVGVATNDPVAFAHEVRAAVLDATDLSCSVGIGDNKLRAKIATGYGKPAGVFTLTAENWFATLGDSPTDALWGIGAKTRRKLADLGLATVRELAQADPAGVGSRLGPTMGPWYVQLARGLDSSPVVGTPYVPRSRSRETTFQANLGEWADVQDAVAELARRVAHDVVGEDRPVARVGVKIRFAPFVTQTRSATLAEHIDPATGVDAVAAALEPAALDVLTKFESRRPVRLAGVRAEFAED